MLPFSRNINIYYRDRAWGEEIYNEVLSKMRVVHLKKDFAVCADGTHVWLMDIRNRNAVRANVALCDEKIAEEEVRALVIPAISPGGMCWISRKKNWKAMPQKNLHDV